MYHRIFPQTPQKAFVVVTTSVTLLVGEVGSNEIPLFRRNLMSLNALPASDSPSLFCPNFGEAVISTFQIETVVSVLLYVNSLWSIYPGIILTKELPTAQVPVVMKPKVVVDGSYSLLID